MPTESKPVFLVDAYSDPVILLINGRASYLNCAPVSQFFEHMIKNGKREFVIDFANCTGMDSTFLGIIAGAALELRKQSPQGHLTLCRLGSRNLELVRNLGLHRILRVDAAGFPMNFEDSSVQNLTTLEQEEIANARTILKAHENLVAADQANLKKFQDVLTFLKNQIEQE